MTAPSEAYYDTQEEALEEVRRRRASVGDDRRRIVEKKSLFPRDSLFPRYVAGGESHYDVARQSPDRGKGHVRYT